MSRARSTTIALLVVVTLALLSIPFLASRRSGADPTPVAPTPPRPDATYGSLRDRGDAKARAGDLEGALALWLQARDVYADDVKLHQRLLKAADELQRRQVGLDALAKISQLDARMSERADVVLLRHRIEQIPSSLPITNN